MLLSLLMCMSCQHEDPEITGLAPYFRVKFINQGSIDILEDSIALVDKALEDISDSLTVIDSLEIIYDTLDLSVNKESLSDLRQIFNEKKTGYNSSISLINSGKMKVQKIEGDDGSGTISYSDSLTLYKIPLNPNTDFSRFYIYIEGSEYSIDTRYERNTIEDNRNIIIQATNFEVLDQSGFRDLSISNSDSVNLTSDGATIVAYF